MKSLKIRSFKSKVAPKGLSFSRNYFQMGDKYVKLVTILNIPKQYYAGILSVLTSNPNITVIEAIIPNCVGIINAQSENGIGAAPSPAAASAAVATTACARRFFLLNSQSVNFEVYPSIPQVMLLP